MRSEEKVSAPAIEVSCDFMRSVVAEMALQNCPKSRWQAVVSPTPPSHGDVAVPEKIE